MLADKLTAGMQQSGWIQGYPCFWDSEPRGLLSVGVPWFVPIIPSDPGLSVVMTIYLGTSTGSEILNYRVEFTEQNRCHCDIGANKASTSHSTRPPWSANFDWFMPSDANENVIDLCPTLWKWGRGAGEPMLHLMTSVCVGQKNNLRSKQTWMERSPFPIPSAWRATGSRMSYFPHWVANLGASDHNIR